MNCPQKRCEPSCAFCLDANEPFLAAPLIFLFSYNARTGYQRSAKRECRQGLRIVRYHFFEKAGKRLSCGPAIFAKKLQKSRETYNFTAFYGGPNRDRTDDLTDANRTLSRGGKFSAHGLRHVGRLYNVRMDYNFLAKTRTANDALKVLHIRFIQLCLE